MLFHRKFTSRLLPTGTASDIVNMSVILRHPSTIPVRSIWLTIPPTRVEHYSPANRHYSTNLPVQVDLLERYRGLVALGRIKEDEEQIRMVMQVIYDALYRSKFQKTHMVTSSCEDCKGNSTDTPRRRCSPGTSIRHMASYRDRLGPHPTTHPLPGGQPTTRSRPNPMQHAVSSVSARTRRR